MSREDTQFKPGQSGNPRGARKKGESIAELMRKYLAEPVEIETGEGDARTKTMLERRELFVRAVFRKAMAGSDAAQKLVWNYMDGLPEANVNLGGSLFSGVADIELDAETEARVRAELARLLPRRAEGGGADEG